MSDHVRQSSSDCDSRTGKSIHSVQSVWMAHWTRTSYNSTAVTSNHAPTPLEKTENNQDSKPLRSIVKLETMSKLSKSVKRLREPETQMFEVINESLRTSSRTIAKESLASWSLPLHNSCENVKTPFQDSMDCEKTHYIGSTIIASTPSLDNPSNLSSHLIPYRDPGPYITKDGDRTQKTFINTSFLAAKEKVPRLGMLEHVEYGRSVTPYLRQNDSFLLEAPSTSRKLGGEEFPKIPGTSSSTINKVNKMDENLPPRLALDCSRNEAGRKPFKLDINLELPAPTDNMEASSSRTESLELGSILARVERASSSRTDICPDGRWLKRLKVSASGSLAFGTKSSSLGRETSYEKSHKFLSEIPKATITNSELASSKRHGKGLMAYDNTSSLGMNSGPSSTSVVKKDLELLTSHSWIQRLLHNRATTASKRPQPVVICEPQTSKLEFDDLQKKQLPSLGAMALMGKAMNGFQPCEFHRKGSLVVWNTRSL